MISGICRLCGDLPLALSMPFDVAVELLDAASRTAETAEAPVEPHHHRYGRDPDWAAQMKRMLTRGT